MGLTAKKQDKPKVQRDLPKKGQRVAKLTGLIDIGTQECEFKGEKKPPARQFIPIFTLLQDTYTTEEGEVVNMVISPFYPINIFEGSEKSNYMKFVLALDPENETLVDDERDLTDLLGRNCFVKVKYSDPTEDGIVYANYDGVTDLPEDYPVPDLVKDFTVFDTENPDKKVFDSLWDRTKDQIRQSMGYAGSHLEAVCDGGEVPAQKHEAPAGEEEIDEELPF